MTETQEHRTRVTISFITGKRKYVAVCLCGWEDPYQRETEQQAEDSGDDHVIAVP